MTEGCSVVPRCCCRLQTAAGVAACVHVCVARQQPSSSCAALRTPEAPSGATGAPLSRAGRRAGAASGDCVFLEAESDADSCTHVVARHAEQPSVGWAAARGRQAVTHFWVWECCRAQHLLPLGDPVRSHSCPAAPVCTGTSLRASCSAHSTGVCSGASLRQPACRHGRHASWHRRSAAARAAAVPAGARGGAAGRARRAGDAHWLPGRAAAARARAAAHDGRACAEEHAAVHHHARGRQGHAVHRVRQALLRAHVRPPRHPVEPACKVAM